MFDQNVPADNPDTAKPGEAEGLEERYEWESAPGEEEALKDVVSEANKARLPPSGGHSHQQTSMQWNNLYSNISGCDRIN